MREVIEVESTAHVMLSAVAAETTQLLSPTMTLFSQVTNAFVIQQIRNNEEPKKKYRMMI